MGDAVVFHHSGLGGGFFGQHVRNHHHPVLDPVTDADTPETVAFGAVFPGLLGACVAREDIQIRQHTVEKGFIDGLHVGGF